MKKYNKIALNVQSIALGSTILTASVITGQDAVKNAGGNGANGGDGAARSNAGGSTIGFDADLV